MKSNLRSTPGNQTATSGIPFVFLVLFLMAWPMPWRGYAQLADLPFTTAPLTYSPGTTTLAKGGGLILSVDAPPGSGDFLAFVEFTGTGPSPIPSAWLTIVPPYTDRIRGTR